MKLSSNAFASNESIPIRYTCDGKNVSPPLTIAQVPEKAESLVLIVDDPDAPDPAAPKRTWVHWVLFNLPPTLKELPEGLQNLPDGASTGRNDWGKASYGGPCPPIGRHRYFHKLYALDRRLSGLEEPTKSQVEKAMHGHVLASAELVGTYEKQRK